MSLFINRLEIAGLYLKKPPLPLWPGVTWSTSKESLLIYISAKPKLSLFYLLSFFSILRLAIAPLFGLGVDEAHYVLYGKYLDLSYVDHPPLVGWIHGLIYYSLGTNEFLARWPAVLIFAGTSYLAYRFTWSISGSALVSLTAVLALNSSFLFNALSIMFLPDSLLLPLAFLFIEITKKIADSGERKYFLYLGLILGLSGLAKYSAILFLPPFLLYFLIRKRYDLLFSKNLIFTTAIALALILPVIIWNWQNDWLSFRYQGKHITSSTPHLFKNFFFSLMAQILSYSPFLFLIAFYGFGKAYLSRNEQVFLAFLLAASSLVFFSYLSLYDVILPHWNCLFFLLFIPLGVNFLSQGGERKKKKVFLQICLGVSLGITIFLYVEVAGKFFRFPDFRSPFQDIYGWDQICQEADRLLKENSRFPKALAVTHWTLGSRVMYYSLPFANEVFVIDKRRDQFDIWQKKPPYGYDLLFVNPHFERADIHQQFRCAQVIPVKRLELTLRGGKVNQIDYVWCHNYQGMKNE